MYANGFPAGIDFLASDDLID